MIQADESLEKTQGPEEICLTLEHQNPSKTSEKMASEDMAMVIDFQNREQQSR